MRKRLEQQVYTPTRGVLGANTESEEPPTTVNWKTGEPFEKQVETEPNPVVEKEISLEQNDTQQMIESVLANFQKRKGMFDPSKIITGDEVLNHQHEKRKYANN